MYSTYPAGVFASVFIAGAHLRGQNFGFLALRVVPLNAALVLQNLEFHLEGERSTYKNKMETA